MKILITGGLGFIGGNFINFLEKHKKIIQKIYNIDCQTYAANKDLIQKHKNIFKSKYKHKNIDISDMKKLNKFLVKTDITHIINFAAETHVDNSISNSDVFIKTNVLGTHNLLQHVIKNPSIRYHQISTDEVFGSLNLNDDKFNENSKYDPKNPYSATKAASDLLVKSFINTYKINAVITNCSNNYGPYQNIEKLIPKTINNLLNNKKVPIYSKGSNVRDWLYVEDHCEILFEILKSNHTGTLCIGGDSEKTNIEIVEKICNFLNKNLNDSIDYVKDRAGHDFRYAINTSKINKIFSWVPKTSLEDGINKTINFYKQ
jgi:dTDP-glucose 4,6-dehydratase